MLFDINLINILFLQLTFVIVVLGSLMTIFEEKLPNSIRQMFRYGKHSHKGESDKLIELIEIPKSWFSHFYVFAIFWSWFWLILSISIYFYEYQPSQLLMSYLDLSCGRDRQPETSPFITFVALFLMTLQCTRRFIESNFLQIFSKKSKINLSHYLCGFLHYYGVFVLIVAKGEGFFTSSKSIEFNVKISEAVRATFVSIVFVYFWYKQYESNMIFINLRKDKSGKVATETHLVPRGGLFEYVSSPHMTCEVGMYLILYVLLLENTSYIFCLGWVITNQCSNAYLSHQWYRQHFSDYPKQRKAFIPYVF